MGKLSGWTDWIAGFTFWLDLLDGVGLEESLEGPGKPL
jgi:hypothetical protein